MIFLDARMARSWIASAQSRRIAARPDGGTRARNWPKTAELIAEMLIPNDLPERALERVLGLSNTSLAERFGAGRPIKRHNVTPLDKLVESGIRLMWVAAHPDDESFGGAIFAKSSLRCGNPLYFLVLTRGEGGECNLPGGNLPDLGTLRTQEMERVAELYNAELQMESFFNAGLPVKSFPRRHEIARKWLEQGNPTEAIAKAIRSFKPDVVLTFAPDYGSTGHPEHQLASRFTTEAIRLADSLSAPLRRKPHRVAHTYYLLNKYWFTLLTGMGNDPLQYTETFDARQHCVGGMLCSDAMGEYSKPHRTQLRDMGMMRRVSGVIHNLYLYRADPFVEIKDPMEFWPVRGMG